MRKVLIVLLILILTMSILWIVAGRQISEFVDQYKTVEIKAQTVHSISYEGTSAVGNLKIDGETLGSLPLNPHIGSTKDNQLALAYAGKVFAFGPLRSSESELLNADVPTGDSAFLTQRESCFPWLSFSVRLSRNRYYQLLWTKSGGPNVKMTWIIDEKDNAPRLIRVEISDAYR